jgi:putative Mg2+ transporter-C (MgtC) family protein
MDFRSFLGEPIGQSSLQLAELALAFVLSASIGLEREIRQKSAGLRTYTLVGFSSALVMLVSKYGFTNILESGRVVLDPSRIAAQIVSGIGFIGGGLIFVRKDIVRGLTTAATVWLTAAVGMACGAGLPISPSRSPLAISLWSSCFPRSSADCQNPVGRRPLCRFPIRTVAASFARCLHVAPVTSSP